MEEFRAIVSFGSDPYSTDWLHVALTAVGTVILIIGFLTLALSDRHLAAAKTIIKIAFLVLSLAALRFIAAFDLG